MSPTPKGDRTPKAAKAARVAAGEAFVAERASFRTLLLANPNHFGNLANSKYPAVLKIAGNTFYEEIGSVGFQPQFDRLEAVVYVRQPSGYGGGVCAAGTPEYVRFYLSTDGKDWDDLGLTSFQAHDIPAGTEGDRRLEYAVTLDISTHKRFCFVDNLAQVRAILSWNAPPPPDDPDFVPVWGDRHDTNIQIAPRKLFPLADLLDEVKVKVPSAFADVLKATEVSVAADPQPVPWAELRKAYGDAVEPHRFAHGELLRAVDQPALHANLQAPGATSIAEALDLDLSKIGDLLFPPDGNTTYERLEAIGLDPNVEHLVGVVRVTKPSGYSGGACTAGSREYVTFWADLDANGAYETYLGTTSVKVHDVASLPDKGLEYSVFLPVDFDKLRRPCWEGARIVPIRAVLSWNVPAPAANPNHVPTWGNRLETLVAVGPGSVLSGHTPIVQTVGSMDVDDIGPATGLANGPAALAGFVATDSPFGGEVVLTGRIANPSDSSTGAAPLEYRIEISDDGVVWQAITNSFQLGLDRLLNGVWSNLPPVNQVVDGSGWYRYREDLSGGLGNAQIFPVGNVLGRWQTAGLTGRWLVRVRVKDPANPGPVWTSSAVAVRIDNEAPTASITITSGNGPCGDFTVGDVIEGTYAASDEHLGSVVLSILPTNGGAFVEPAPAPAGSTMPLSRAYPFISGTSDSGTWKLDTTTLGRCGYVISVHVSDRTIVNSGYVGHHTSEVVGLCLRD